MAHIAMLEVDQWGWKRVASSGTTVAHSIGVMGAVGCQAREIIALDADHIRNCTHALLDSGIAPDPWANVRLHATGGRKLQAYLPDSVVLEDSVFPAESDDDAQQPVGSKRQRTQNRHTSRGQVGQPPISGRMAGRMRPSTER